MNKYITAAFGILIVLVFGFAAGRWFTPAENPRVIATTGECLAKVERDTTAITLRVTILKDSPAESLQLAGAEYSRISEYLRGIQDNSMEIQTVRFDVNEKTEWNHVAQKSESLGYETNIELSVSTKDKSTIESIIAQTGHFNDAYPENLRMFTSPEKMKPALEACIQTAVENARDKAEAIAAAEDSRVGKMISASFGKIAGGNDYEPRPLLRAGMAKGVAFDSAAVELFSKDSDISVSVNVSFQVK
ncbi:MAG: SIMPL domain-containing protein [Rickettsiales bacterium]|jgi:uncharacterized protein YggE|nr:SIMPL domain-containing protein [Rickettsiales bacterium]